MRLSSIAASVFTGMALMMFVPCSAKSITAEEAAGAAMTVERPAFENMLTHDSRNDTIPKDAVGSTDDLTQLRGEDGMGDLFTPGSGKANACLDANDPECLAVQLVYQGGANPPSLSDEDKNQIFDGYDDVKDNVEDIVGEADDMVSSDIRCETVTTVIPGRSEIEVCDIGEGVTSATCSEGWTMDKGLEFIYRCHLLSTGSTEVCQLTHEVLYHHENRYQCKKEDAVYENVGCTIPVTVNVDKTYPYTCKTQTAQDIQKRCVRTLNVTAEPGCVDDRKLIERLNIFKDVGYSGSSTQMRANVTLDCGPSLLMRIKFGNKTMVTFTESPSTVTATYRIEFVLSIRNVTIDGVDRYEVTITNTDTGQGTRIITFTMPVITNEDRVTDSWSEVCS